MNKKNLIIWGGNNKKLSIDSLDSHASVNAFFLSKYLKNYFNIINITDIDNPKLILGFDNIDHIISTAQYGFTNRLIKKNKLDLFNKIRKHVKGKICSIADYAGNDNYVEDILFLVRPINFKNHFVFKNFTNTTLVRTGWCAEPNLFFPEFVENLQFNIFIDHAPYTIASKNYISLYYNALKRIVIDFPKIKFNIYHQNNNGIILWNFESEDNLNHIYNRKIKVPYVDVIEIMKKIHIFCYTHEESAGLSGIEAACAGSKLYIPTNFFGKTCIKKDLLNSRIDYSILSPLSCFIYNRFKKDILKGINRKENHLNISNSNHTWKSASEKITEVLF